MLTPDQAHLGTLALLEREAQRAAVGQFVLGPVAPAPCDESTEAAKTGDSLATFGTAAQGERMPSSRLVQPGSCVGFGGSVSLGFRRPGMAGFAG